MRVAPDPYLPSHGDSRYGVEHYDLALDYRLSTNRLDAVATLTVRAREPLTEVRLDLSGLHVNKVTVDGKRPKKYTHSARVLTVKLASEVGAGGTATLRIAYSGKPTAVPGAHGAAGWEELSDGVLVSSQPYGAPSFYPCNDRADDKASYAITVTTDADYTVVATGRPGRTTTRSGRTTWTFEEPTPTASYLVSIAIGRLGSQTLPGAGDRVTLFSPRARAVPATSPLLRLPAMLDALEGWFGPYPLPDFRAVVVDDPLEIPLEAQGMASFGTNHLTDDWDNERLVVHELSHQWFGNAVTGALLSDIWLHEGFACYTEWLWSQARGLGSADERAARHHKALPLQRQATPLSDPGMPAMFDDWVYKRGALTLHALRAGLGDEAFFTVCRTWVAQHSVATTAGFVDHVARVSGTDCSALLSAWLDAVALPPCPRLR
ncbi:MAG: M1 family metallopeptidase [Propionibacteriaceae bacterium]|nr:M1 family metallopeptidase [Propionibacteriaceae bacterium]